MEVEAQRGRQEQIRSAKRALRQFQRRRAQEQSKRASRTLRASLLVKGADTPTLLTQCFTASNAPESIARESAARATDKSRRRRSRPSVMYIDNNSAPGSRQSSQTCFPNMGGANGPCHSRKQSSISSSRLPTMTAGHRLSLARQSLIDQQRNSLLSSPSLNHCSPSRRRSRHSRQFSIGTRGEGFEVMSGQPVKSIEPDQPVRRASIHRRASRVSVRFSSLEPASILFGNPSVQKPLPPIPSDWKAGLRDTDSPVEEEDRTTALEKLEGRHRPSMLITPNESPTSTTASPSLSRPIIPSWLSLGDSSSPSKNLSKMNTVSKRETFIEPLVEEVNDGSSSLEPVERDESTPRPSDPDIFGISPESRKNPLRPLKLGTLSPARRPTMRASPASKSPKRVSSITYKASHDPDSSLEKVTTPTRSWSESMRKHMPNSSRDAYSTVTSWTASDQTQSLFSPDSNVSGSPGATSIDSTDHTVRKRGFRMDESLSDSLQHQLTTLHSQLDEERERHQQEVISLQRELEEVREVMGSQLISLRNAKESAQEQASKFEAQIHDMQMQLEDTSGERDMYKEDIVDWRSRCSDLEHTIQSQQLRLNQERTWRRVAMKRMQAMSTRLRAGTATGSDVSTASTDTSHSSALPSMPDLPELPELPSEDEAGLWTQRVARQLSKHAPNSSNAPELAPETIKLLSDMREQILTLYSALRLEESNHALTREQLHEAKERSALVESEMSNRMPKSEPSVPELPLPQPSDSVTLDMSTPIVTHVEEGSRVPTNHDTTADILFPPPSDLPNESQDEQALIGLGFSSVPDSSMPQLYSNEPSSCLDSSYRAATEGSFDRSANKPMYTSDHAVAASLQESGEALPLSESGTLESETNQLNPAPFVTTNEPAWPEVEASFSTDTDPHHTKVRSLDLDLECGGDDSAWVSEDEDEQASEVDTDDKSSPPTPRPEFIPEWSFDQAMFEANRDVRSYKESGCHPQNRYARRGARRVRKTPVEDFFGVLDVRSDSVKPLPMPDYALDMPPVDLNKLAPAFEYQPSVLSSPHTTAAVSDGSKFGGITRAPLLDEPWQSPKNRGRASRQQQQPTSYGKEEKTSAGSVTPNNGSGTAQLVSQMLSGWVSARTPETCIEEESYPDVPSYDVASPVFSSISTPVPADSHLAPSIPAPSTPIPRSPGYDARSPVAPGHMRLIKHNPLTRIPVPTPIWLLNFERTTDVPNAAPSFTI